MTRPSVQYAEVQELLKFISQMEKNDKHIIVKPKLVGDEVETHKHRLRHQIGEC